MGFNNYKNKSANFDSFNGTELKAFLKITTEYDEYMRTKSFELVELGRVSAITGAEQYVNEPHIAIGFSRPVALATGDSIVAGAMSFEVFKEGFVNEVKRVLAKAGLKKLYLEYDKADQEKPQFGYSEINSINDFPMMDIVLIGVKENNPDKKIQKEIKGIRFTKGNSAIGVTQLVVREQYNYMAKAMTDFQPVNGAEEDVVGDKDETEVFIFG